MRHLLLTIACGVQLVAAYDLQAKTEHIVHLSSEKHHDSLAKEWPNALHAITHLPSGPALILDLTPADFEWLTHQLLGVAAVCCPGRVVSVLEGGYGSYEFSKESTTGLAHRPPHV